MLVAIIAALAAFLIPEIDTGDQLLNSLTSFAAFAPLAIYLAALINTRLQLQDLKAFAATGIVALFLGYFSYFADHGFLAKSASLWWHPLVISIGMFAGAVTGFNVEYVKKLAEFIFDYSWKKNK